MSKHLYREILLYIIYITIMIYQASQQDRHLFFLKDETIVPDLQYNMWQLFLAYDTT